MKRPPTHILPVAFPDKPRFHLPPLLDGGAAAAAPTTPTPITTLPVGVPGSQAPSLHVRDVTNGFELYAVNADVQSPFPASCTKMMTALLANEYHSDDWTATVTVTADDVAAPLPPLTLDSAGLADGDVVSWQQLAYGLMLPSGCDCCQVIARIIGDAVYAAAGNTGTQGRTRFVELMNARAAQLGVAGTFTDAYGGSRTFSPTVDRNVLSARDLTKVCAAMMARPALRTIAGTVTFDCVIASGPSPRTLNWTNYNKFINGPFLQPAGIKDTRVAGGKDGVWVLGGTSNYSKSQLWVSPAGYEVVITVLGAIGPWGLHLDQQGVIYALERDFPYLRSGSPTDANYSKVKVLIGADGSIVEETIGRTITNTSVTLGAPVNCTTGGAVFNAGTDQLAVASAAALNVGSQDMTCEVWYAGDGTLPSGEYIWMGKFDGGSNNAWTFDLNSWQFQAFVSQTGSGFTNGNLFDTSPYVQDRGTLFNGLPHLLSFQKAGNVWALYIDGEKCPNTLTVGFDPFGGTAPVTVGFAGVSALGRYDDFRLTVGAARYGAVKVTVSPRQFARS